MLSSQMILGIARESGRLWERRAPLLPEHVLALTKAGVRVLLQPCSKRVVPNSHYVSAGAILSESMNDADVILGIKEFAPVNLIAGKTFLFFSHTHKGQMHNMPMLQHILKQKIRLIDYELLKDKSNTRIVKFGEFAGYAGFIDGLHVLGKRLLGLGYSTPFLNIGMAHSYRNIQSARNALNEIAKDIYKDGFPNDLGPFVFAMTGRGSVAKGVSSMLSHLPHTWISSKSLRNQSKFTQNMIYATKISTADIPLFYSEIAPYVTFLLTAHYYDSTMPRLLTIEQTRVLFPQLQQNKRLLSIADISCDIEGSLEFISQTTSIDDPFYIYNPESNTKHKNLTGKGIQIMAIDILPTEFPLEASKAFGDALMPVLSSVLSRNWDSSVLKNATIAANGHLTSEHEWLNSMKTKRVLILGSGFVSGPVIEYLRSRKLSVTTASLDSKDGIYLNVAKCTLSELVDLISSYDIVISLVPAYLHVSVARACIKAKKPLVTASYISPEMAALDLQAKNAGIALLNEIGLDPGIDHMSAAKFIHSVSSGKIVGFQSWCGGLPEHADNPLGYKFSWSPRGVLMAALNSAEFKRSGTKFSIPSEKLLNTPDKIDFLPKFALEAIPNRNSLEYIQKYNLDNDIETMYRGTLRFKGFISHLKAFKDLNLLDSSLNTHKTWPALISECLNLNYTASKSEIVEILSNKVPMSVINGMQWLGMFENEIQNLNKSKIDTLCDLLQSKLSYKQGERDMVIMRNCFTVRDKVVKDHVFTLICYGDPNGFSAMAKTVGYPVAIAANLILEGKFTETGVITPTIPSIYDPVLKELEEFGIKFTENK